MALVKKSKWLTVLLAVVFYAQWGWADTLRFNMRQGVTAVSRDVYHLHMWAVYVSAVIAVLVFGTMFVSMFRHRRSKHPLPASFHHSTLVEIIWTTIPFLILTALAIPATKTLIEIEDNTKSDMSILVTGHQWKWQYKYLGQGVEFYSSLATSQAAIHGTAPKGKHYLLEVDRPLVLPIGKKVRFLVTSKDVIHSWFVPDFAIKQDAVPGFINEAWTRIDKPGTYRGQCAELCGKDHGFMPIVVVAKTEADYQIWLAQQKAAGKAATEAAAVAAASRWSMDKLLARGQRIYNKNCAACHMPNGRGNGPFPALDGSKIVAGPVAAHIRIVTHGKNAMPAWKGVLSDADIAAAITYERNAWSNKTGDAVQPADVVAALKKEG